MKKKILYFVNEDFYFCSHRLPLALEAKRKGYEVVVLTRVRDHGEKIRDAGLELVPIEIKRRSINPFVELLTLFRVVRSIISINPDIIHNIALKQVVYGNIACIFNKKIKSVNLIAGLGTIFTSRKIKAKLLKPILSFLFFMLFKRKNVRVIVQNPDDLKILTKKIKISPAKINLILGSGVNTDIYKVTAENNENISIALVSRLLWDKGVGVYIDALRELKKRGLEFTALLVGWPDNENIAAVPNNRIDEWVNEGLIKYPGYVSDIPKFWENVNIAVLPSFYGEGVPKSLIEAASCGRAIVTTNTPGCREIVQNGFNGILVPVKDVNSLADSLEKLVNDHELRRKMGENGRKLVEEKFSEKQVLKETLTIYDEVLVKGESFE